MVHAFRKLFSGSSDENLRNSSSHSKQQRTKENKRSSKAKGNGNAAECNNCDVPTTKNIGPRNDLKAPDIGSEFNSLYPNDAQTECASSLRKNEVPKTSRRRRSSIGYDAPFGSPEVAATDPITIEDEKQSEVASQRISCSPHPVGRRRASISVSVDIASAANTGRVSGIQTTLPKQLKGETAEMKSLVRKIKEYDEMLAGKRPILIRDRSDDPSRGSKRYE